MKPSEAIASWYQEERGAEGAYGREGGETGFAWTKSQFYSVTEVAEWDVLSQELCENEIANTIESCECCGPVLTPEGEREDARIRAEFLPTWYQRRNRASLSRHYAG